MLLRTKRKVQLYNLNDATFSMQIKTHLPFSAVLKLAVFNKTFPN
jgi:hypothetical protein